MSSDESALASVTRLRVRALSYMPGFLWHAFLGQRHAKRAPGFVGGALLVDAHRTFWTLTVWESEKAMKAFRGSGRARTSDAAAYEMVR
jgi:hypothetical protein